MKTHLCDQVAYLVLVQSRTFSEYPVSYTIVSALNIGISVKKIL